MAPPSRSTPENRLLEAELAYVEAETRRVDEEARKLAAETVAVDFARRRDRTLLLVFLLTAITELASRLF